MGVFDEFEFQETPEWLSPVILVQKDGMIGLLDLNGSFIIPFGHLNGLEDLIYDAENGFVFVQGADGKWGRIHIQALSYFVLVPSDTVGAYIDLTGEEIFLPPGFEPDVFSDGRRPRDISRFERDFPRMLRRGFTLSLTNKAGVTINFAPVSRQPRNRERLRPWYFDDITGPGNLWILSGRINPTAPAPGYEYVHIEDRSDLRLKPYEHEWEGMEHIYMEDRGIEVEYGDDRERGMVNIYLARSRATVSGGNYFPAGRPFRIRPKPFGKAPRLKVRNDNTVRLKPGFAYSIDDGPFTLVTARGYLLDLSVLGDVEVRRAATGRRPASWP
jgi:hypothetical protein